MAADAKTIERLGQEVFEFPELRGFNDESEDDAGTQGVLTRLLHEARTHYEEELEPRQTEGTDYYWGRPFGDEKKGRSKVVSTDLRDVTLGQLPDLIQLFMGPDNMIEFEPQNEGQVEIAEQQTDYINHVIWEDNAGFATILAWLTDGLVRGLGVVKWYWDVTQRLVEDRYTGLSEDQLITLVTDEHVDDFEINRVRYQKQWNTQVFDVTVQRWTTSGVARFEGVPNEEFWFTPNARTLAKAQVVAHSREVTVSEVVALGYKYEDIRRHVGPGRHQGSEDLDSARQFHGGDGTWTRDGDGEGDRSQSKVRFTEAYGWLDTDDDDVSELRRFHCIGDEFVILPDPDTGSEDGVAVERHPFAVFTPYPEPHTVVGLCNYDLTKDIQRIKSQLLRALMDTTAQATDGQMEVVHNEVNMKDMMSPEVSKVIRVRKPGMIREIKHTYVGGETITSLEYMDEVRAERTGRTRASEGLDPDSLQSSTKEAVHATLGKNQARVYMIAQVFAETALKDLFRGLHELIVQHQDYARMVRLRGTFVEIDPRQWDTPLDLKVNVAIGMGTPIERAAVLAEMLTRQEMYIEKGVPFVKFTHLRRTLDRITKLMGHKNPQEFWGKWGPEEQQAYEQAMAAMPQSDPAQEVVEVEKFKVQQEGIFKRDELDLKRMEITMRDQREREKNARDAALEEFELELKFATDLQDRTVDARVQMAKATLQASTQRATAQAKSKETPAA
jgi:hypothetical protein